MSQKLPKKRLGYMKRGAKTMTKRTTIEFPSRHVNDTEDLRTLLNEFLDKTVSIEEYNHLLGKLEDAEDQYTGALAQVEELQEIVDDHLKTLEEYKKQLEGLQEVINIQSKELEGLRNQPQEKKTLKKLEKKPLKRLK